MPLYDYECSSCGHLFELRQSFHEAGVGTCPQCSAGARRKFHAVPVIYKGSGFYTTDYGRPKTPPSEQKEKEEKESNKETKAAVSKESSNGSEAKTDSATKATSEVKA